VTPVISAILPPGVVAAELIGELVYADLLPEEAAALGPSTVEKRRREFAAGRSLGRRALEQLGVVPVAIPVGANREPLWPQGVAGSITHCDGYGAAAVAFASEVRSIGIDAEVHERLSAGVIGLVARPEEREWIEARAGDAICWDRVLFSAKESVFKAWFPIMGRWLGFEDATVVFDTEATTFRANLLTDAVVDGRVITTFHGRYLVHGDHVLTSVIIEPRG